MRLSVPLWGAEEGEEAHVMATAAPEDSIDQPSQLMRPAAFLHLSNQGLKVAVAVAAAVELGGDLIWIPVKFPPWFGSAEL